METAVHKIERRSQSRPIEVGDVVIMNEIEQPCGRMLVVVVGRRGEYFLCQYLNADKVLDRYNRPPMLASLTTANRIDDFGVEFVVVSEGKYLCRRVGESKAIYRRDGTHRSWQEYGETIYRYRPEVFAKIRRKESEVITA